MCGMCMVCVCVCVYGICVVCVCVVCVWYVYVWCVCVWYMCGVCVCVCVKWALLCPLLTPPYLLLDVVNFRSQPLDHAVDLSNLLLGVAQVVPMSASCDLQLLILKANQREDIYVSCYMQKQTHL